MLYAKNLPSNAGVEILGDPLDFDRLYDSLHEIVGREGEHEVYEGVGMRVLAVCYEIRHALMGDREIEFIDNGMDGERKRRMAVLAPDRNLYYKIRLLWPEALFVQAALNDYVRMYAKTKTKQYYDMMLQPKLAWDPTINQVRQFQTAVAACLQELVSPAAYSRMLNQLCKDYPWLGGYTWQYVDVLNHQFYAMSPEKRLKQLSTMAKRLGEWGTEYQAVRTAVQVSARHHGVHPNDIAPPVEPIDDFAW